MNKRQCKKDLLAPLRRPKKLPALSADRGIGPGSRWGAPNPDSRYRLALHAFAIKKTPPTVTNPPN